MADLGATATLVRHARASPRSTLLTRVLPFLPVTVLAWQGWDRRWVTDDGFINLRVVDMVLAGHGPVFNAGERVETTTSVLWLWVLVVGDVLLPLRLEWVAVLLGLALTLTGLVLATAASLRLWRHLGARTSTSTTSSTSTTVLVPAGAMLLAVTPPIWDFATSGMEGGLSFAWIGLVAWMLSRWGTGGDDRHLRPIEALVIGLGPLVRPDLTLVSAVVLAGVLAAQWRTTGWRARLATVGAAVALPLAYQVFRMGYFAALVPNTALAKNADSARWSTGWFYLRDLIGTYALWLPLLLVAGLVGVPLVQRARGNLRLLVAVAALPVAGMLATLYIVRVGGDYMHGRLLLPALWAVLAPVAAAPLPRLLATRFAPSDTTSSEAELPDTEPPDEAEPSPAVGPWRWAAVGGLAVVAVWAVVCLGWLRHPGHRTEAHGLVVDARAGVVRDLGVAHPVTAESLGYGPDSARANPPPAAVYLNGQPTDITPPEGLRTPAYPAFGIGISGYALGPDYYILDMMGLADPIESRLRADQAASLPGHEKLMPTAWLVARVSQGPLSDDAVALLPEPLPFVFPLYESEPGALDADTDAARHVLACPALRELIEAVREPMTPGRFFDNLTSAVRLTRLDIAPDPHEAEDELC